LDQTPFQSEIATMRPTTRHAQRGAPTRTNAFEIVRVVGLTLPDVQAATRYDGSPLLKLGGIFLAGLATHPSAEPDTLVVRHGDEEREWLIEDAPETYYLTDYYRRYPLVLVRLSHITRDALRDVLSVSWRLTAAKTRTGRRDVRQGRGSARARDRSPSD
jgi:hypothetical protein